MKDLIVVTLRDIITFPELAGRAWQSGALGHEGVPAKPDWPFSLFREINVSPYPEVQETSRCSRHDYLVYIYDDRGSYKRIDDLLRRARDTLKGKVQTAAPSGIICMGVEWFGTSGDLVDKELNSNTKYATIRITANL